MLSMLIRLQEINYQDCTILLFWQSYLKNEDTWEPVLAVMHLYKMNTTFDINHLEKSIVTSPLINSALPMDKPLAKPLV